MKRASGALTLLAVLMMASQAMAGNGARSIFRYSGGTFVKLDTGNWVERRDQGPDSRFEETGRTDEYVQLYDANRDMYVRLYHRYGVWQDNQSGKWSRWPGSDGYWQR